MKAQEKRIIVFASGASKGGGSGFQELVENSQTGVLHAHIVAVVSNYERGCVREKAEALGIPFVYFPGPWEVEEYKRIVEEHKPDLVSLSGWLKLVHGLPPRLTINIHPAPLPRFGGKGMYGHHVHGAAIEAFKSREAERSAVTMHFVTEKYDEGPIFFQYPVFIQDDDTPLTLAARVNKIEHAWQSFITNLVLEGDISWDGKNKKSLIVPSWYTFHKPVLS